MEIRDRVAVITGAGGGIGQAVAAELSSRGVKAMALVDMSAQVEEVAAKTNRAAGRPVAYAFMGDATNEDFRRHVYDEMAEKFGPPVICIPAAGITRDSTAVKIDKESGKAIVYPLDRFRLVVEVNLIAPVYWAMEMVARIAEDRTKRRMGRWDPRENVQGTVIFIGSVSSRGNKGQIAYSATKRGLEGAASTLMSEAIYYGVRCAVIHPGYTNTPMVQALGQEYIEKRILPATQLRRLIQPEEIADAICFLISNSAVSGELWADAGWHPST
jgi:3-oxoacyl-[acyl-carrier protein] reductase